MTNNPTKESNGEARENQYLMAIKEPEKYDFLTLVAMDESDIESNNDKVAMVIDPELDNSKPECNEENMDLMAGVGSYDKDSALLDTKVSFEQAKANIYTYSKEKIESLSEVLIEAYLTVCDSKKHLLEDYS